MATPEMMQEPPQNAKTQPGWWAMMRGRWDGRMWGTSERWGSKWRVWALGMFFFFFFPLFYLLTQSFLFFRCGLRTTVSTLPASAMVDPYPAPKMTTMRCHCHQLLYSKEPAIAGLPRCRSCYVMGDSGPEPGVSTICKQSLSWE
jgi:hypothetical protein